MKIVWIVDELITARTQSSLLKLLKGLKAQGDSLFVICLGEAEALTQALAGTEIPVRSWVNEGSSPLESLWLLQRLKSCLQEEQPDIVQTFLARANILGVLAAHQAQIPAIFSSRRDFMTTRHRWYSPLVRHLDHYLKATIVNSHALREKINEYEGLPLEKMVVIHDGVPILPDLPLRKIAFLKSLGWPAEAQVLGVHARWLQGPEGEGFLAQLKFLLKDHPQRYLLIEREAPLSSTESHRLLQRLQSQGLTEQSRLVSGSQARMEALGAINLVIAPQDNDITHDLLEYMAAGRAIVAPALAQNLEFLQHARSGWLLPSQEFSAWESALQLLLNDSALPLCLGAEAYRQAQERFSLENMVQGYRALYQETLTRDLNS